MDIDHLVLKILNERKRLESEIEENCENMELVIQLLKQKSKTEKIFNLCRMYRKLVDDIQSNKLIIADVSADEELVKLAKEDLKSLDLSLFELQPEIEEELKPKDPNDDKNIILEIRAGTGGEEASLFAENLMTMYMRYSEYKGWKFDIIESHMSESKGIKTATINIIGQDVYSVMKYESGTHRVQRVPETENSGRLHTSAATVVVLPELDEIDVNIRKEDLEIDVFRSGGAGGQHVNKTESAVRITHLPTGIIVVQQDGRSQIANKEKALKIIRARVSDFEQRKRDEEITSVRKNQLGSGDRSEKIRTYNFPQNRITDHRINFSLHNLYEVINQGKGLDLIVKELKKHAFIDSQNINLED